MTKPRKTALLAGVIASIAALALSACSGAPGGTDGGSGEKLGGNLVIYTMNEQNMVDAVTSAFKEETGVTVDLVTASTGQLYQRVRAEQANPQGDVFFGGLASLAVESKELWEPYTSPNDAEMEDIGRNIGGFSTPYQADGSNLLVNKDKGGSFNIKGYGDLLQPGLKGNIAYGDPTQSSSAFAHLTNMLKVMGGYESDEAWAFVEKFVDQLDGKVIGSSSQVAQDTANGEFAVALSYEAQSTNMVMSGQPVEIVYMSEGSVWLPTGIQIIKGGPNNAQAKAFIDFMISERGQEIIATETAGRPLRKGVQSANLKPLSEITVAEEDIAWVTEHRQEIVERYQALVAG